MSRFFPGLMSTFFDWENFPSLSERLASYELWGSFETLSSSFPITSVGKLLLRFGFGVNPLSSPPPLTDVFFIGWTRAVLSVSPILLLFREPDAHFVLVSYSIVDLWAPQFGSSPSWLCLNFMCVHNFPIGSEVCDFPLCFMSDPKIVLPLPGFIHCAQIL